MTPNSGLSLCQPMPAPARYSLTPICRKASCSYREKLATRGSKSAWVMKFSSYRKPSGCTPSLPRDLSNNVACFISATCVLDSETSCSDTPFDNARIFVVAHPDALAEIASYKRVPLFFLYEVCKPSGRIQAASQSFGAQFKPRARRGFLQDDPFYTERTSLDLWQGGGCSRLSSVPSRCREVS